MNIKRYSKYMAFTAICFCVIFIFIFFYKLYPLKYKSYIIEASIQCEIDNALIASIINTESGFNKSVVSNKGAVGLMQILPSTAKWICEREDIKFNEDDLFVPNINIKIGVYYLKYLITKFNVVETAIVAYNAGEGNVANWLNNRDYSLDGKTLKVIPFKESESYLKKVKNSIGIYRIRF